MSKTKFARRTGESRYPDWRIILYTSYDSTMDEIRREKCLKEWRRS